jgi:thymidylate synthase
MTWPNEFSDQIIIGNLDSNIAIVTLWTKKEKIIEFLDKEDYAIIGQLYSPEEGLNAMIRNCLSNKKITEIIITGTDLSKSSEALINFFNKGVDENHKVKNLNITIDEEIPIKTLNELRKNITLHDLRSIKDYFKLKEYIKNISKKDSYGKNETYPKKKIQPPLIFPSENAGFIVREDYIYEAWIKILNLIMRFGNLKQSQYFEDQKELISLISVINQEDPNNPKIEHCFNFDKEELEKYFPQVLSDINIEGVEYTYGQRLRNNNDIDQISKIIEKIKKTAYTRRAIAFTWDVKKDYDNDKSPCLCLVQCIVQNSKLYLTAFFRSNDMYNAWPKNAFALRKLQSLIAEEINIELGSIIIISNSAHIYKSSWKNSLSIIEHFTKEVKPIGDPRGNIIIRVEENKISLVHQDPDGKRINSFEGKTAVSIYKKLVKENYVSELSHAFYLGTELQKAEHALKNNKEYVQDG